MIGLLVLAGLIGIGAAVTPIYTVAGALATAFAVIAVRNFAAGVAVFTVLTFLEQIPAISGSGLTLTKFGGGVLAVVWLFSMSTEHRLGHRQRQLWDSLPALAFAAVGVLAWSFLTTLWATSATTAGLTALRFGQSVLLIFILFAALRRESDITLVVYAFLSGAVIAALVGLSGVTQLDRPDVVSTGRIAGSIGDPNELAAVLLPALALAMFMLSTKRGRIETPLLLGVAAICGVAILATGSRGGLIGLGAMLLAAVLFAGRARHRLMTMIATVLAVAAAYSFFVAPHAALVRITDFSAGGGSGRADIWSVAARVYENHPLVGVGVGNFTILEPQYAYTGGDLPRFDLISQTPTLVHNMYLNILVELGVVGFLLFCVMIISALVPAGRSGRVFDRLGNHGMGMVARGVVVGTIGLLAAYTFLSAQYDKPLPLLLGLLASIAALAHRSEDIAPR